MLLITTCHIPFQISIHIANTSPSCHNNDESAAAPVLLLPISPLQSLLFYTKIPIILAPLFHSHLSKITSSGSKSQQFTGNA
jgi:hypothetical protein